VTPVQALIDTQLAAIRTAFRVTIARHLLGNYRGLHHGCANCLLVGMLDRGFLIKALM
jgi:hypothetical protein